MKNLTELINGRVPPQAERRPHTTSRHGQSSTDDFAWLKTLDWQAVLRGTRAVEPDILAYLQAENDYAAAALEPTLPLQEQLLAEMRGRIQQEQQELPEKDGPYEYYWRYQSAAEQPRLCRRVFASDNDEQCLLDAEQEASGFGYFELGDYEVSPDHRWLAWSCDTLGSELCELRFRCLDTGADLPHKISDVDTVTWLSRDTVIYVKVDAHHHANEVWRYRIGTDIHNAQRILTEHDPAFELAVGRLRSGEYVEIVASCDGQDEVWLMETAQRAVDPWLSEPWCFQPRVDGLEYSVDHQGERFLILTNAFGAVDFQIMVTGVANTGRNHWKTWLPARQGVMLHSVDCYRDWVVWLEQRDALPILCFSKAGSDAGEVEFDDVAYELDYDMSPEFNSNTLRYTFESPTTPLQTWEYNLESNERRLLKQTIIPSGHQPTNYRTARLQATSADGAQVPITCVYHKDTVIDGNALCVLEGYGSYGSSLDMGFDQQRISLLDRGVVWALAHVRGGAEKGMNWYYEARGANKIRSVEDYLACIDCLVAEGYSRAAGVAGLGRSAGGLLIGAALNLAPERFVGAIADVPFVDVLNTMQDESHPLTAGEWGQWGNPITDPDAYAWIAQWSPYDNVTAQQYPPLLVTTALADPRVGYWEAAKWVARLRCTGSPAPALLFRTDMHTGHSGSAGRFEALRSSAREFAFVLALDNIN